MGGPLLDLLLGPAPPPLPPPGSVRGAAGSLGRGRGEEFPASSSPAPPPPGRKGRDKRAVVDAPGLALKEPRSGTAIPETPKA